MRWFGLGWTLAALVACTGQNPEFDGEVGPVSMEDTDHGTSSGSSSPSSGLVTTDSAGSMATSAGTTGDEPDDSGEGSETGAAFDVPGVGECPEDPFAGFKIGIDDAALGAIEPDCGVFDELGVVTVFEDGASLLVEVCESATCDCMAPEISYSVSLGYPDTVPDVYGGCRRVRVWSTRNDKGACDWAGFAVLMPDGTPLVVGANRLAVDLPSTDVQVQFGDGEECGERSCSDSTPHPGRYALHVDGIDVWPDDEPAEVFFGDLAFSFDNRMSYVSQACQERVSWHAVAR